MKLFKRVILIIFLLIVLIYVTNITAIPNSVIVFQDESLELGTINGIYIDNSYRTMQTGIVINGKSISKKTKVSLKLFNFIKVKDIEVNVIPKTTVIPLGNSVRIKTLYKWSFSSRTYRSGRRKTI